MLLVFLSWIYILITATNFGILFKKLFRIENCHIAVHQVLGLFFYGIITSIFAFFIRINIEFYLLILIINILVILKHKSTLKTYINSSILTFKSFKFQYKLLYLFLFILILAQSSTKPYLLDNESYYIQTIKWLNEFGYVKGLANLHMFLGQNSSWHILQAGFNFPFITDLFNDLNGFIFVIIGFLAIEKLNVYRHKKNIQHFNFGLVLIFSLFLMQFVNAPSPDLIIFLITPYIFYLFILKYKNISIDDFKIILSLVLFLCFVKVTMIILSVLVFILFIKHYHNLKTKLFDYTLLSSVILGLFLIKNSIISGYLFYPIETLDVLNVDWKLPKSLLIFYKKGTFLAGINNTDVSYLSFLEKFKYWLSIPKLHGLFNKIFILLLFIFPWFVIKQKEKNSLLIIYILAIIQLTLLWFSSPQYRFFFVFIIFLSIQILSSIFKDKKIGMYLIYLSLFSSAVALFFNINLNTLTKNEFSMKLSVFKLKNIVVPDGNSKTITQFNKFTIDGFEFNSPNEDTFFWSSGNGDLPCVNKKQIDYIRHYYKYLPQQRTENLEDGFRSILTEK